MTAISPNHPAYDTYRRRVAGEKIPMAESQPEAGFYRYKSRSGGGVVETVVTIMPNRNDAPWDLIAYVGPERRIVKPIEIWTYIAGKHVRPDVAKSVLENGVWPEDGPPAPALNQSNAADITVHPVAGHELNNAKAAGVGPIEDAKSYLEIAEAFARRVSKGIDDERLANQAANVRDELLHFAGDKGVLRTAHTAEKAPWLEKCREVDALYLRLIDEIRAVHVAIGVPLKVYMDGIKAKADAEAAAERRRLEEEAEKKRQAAIAEARARQDEDAAKQIEAVPVAALVEVAPPEPAKVAVGGQRSGRRTTLKKETTYAIEDLELVFAAVKDQVDVIEAIQKAVNRLSKAGAKLPGVKKIEGTRL